LHQVGFATKALLKEFFSFIKFLNFKINFSNLPAGRQVIFEALAIANVKKFEENLAEI
jgi:hypothetical protein